MKEISKLQSNHLDVTYVNNKTGNETVALKNINLDIKEGEFICIVGPSGCGKTTFLNTVVGFVEPSRGQITLDNKKINGPGKDRAMVFQSASLLPWKTVKSNVLYGLQLQKRLNKQTKAQADKYIELVGLKDFASSYPHELSGGMQQRVNLARALTADPTILLLDEPFSALDAQTREHMQHELLNIWKETKKTSIFITHQIDEAVYLADRVMVFGARPGRLIADIEIEIERPRKLSIKRNSNFLEYVDQIWSLIETNISSSNN